MRKKLFLVSGLLAATLFTACNNEEISMPQGDNEASQELVLALSDGSLNMARSSNAFARAAKAAGIGDAGAINAFGRPLYSSMAAQDIQNIKIYFVHENNTIAHIVNVDETHWKQSLAYQNGRKLLISLKKKDLGGEYLDGKYQVYAVAYSTKHGYDAFTPALDAVKVGDTWSEFSASVLETSDPSEIFAGQSEVTASASNVTLTPTAGKGEAMVTLYRQLAGVSGYFTNIPVKPLGETPTHLRLVASGKNTVADFVLLEKNVGDDETIKQTNYVVNGKTPAATKDANYFITNTEGYVVYEIDLNKWFNNDFAGADKDGDGFVGYKDVVNGGVAGTATWTNPNANVNNHVQGLVKGSVWGGKFVIPFAQSTGVPTFQLQLVKKSADGTTVELLKHWNIKLTQDDLHKATGVQLPTGVTAAVAGDESVEVYNIYRNHMYSIGKKSFDNVDPNKPVDPGVDPNKPVNPDKPTEPTDPDKNEPGDLSKGQDLTIHVNSNWEAVHDMEID